MNICAPYHLARIQITTVPRRAFRFALQLASLLVAALIITGRGTAVAFLNVCEHFISNIPKILAHLSCFYNAISTLRLSARDIRLVHQTDIDASGEPFRQVLQAALGPNRVWDVSN